MSLTTDAETKVLTAGNDTVDGGIANSVNGDIILDQSTTDNDVANLKVTLDAQAATISNVETINLDFAGFGLGFNAANVNAGTIVAKTTQLGNSTATISGLSNKGVNVQADTSIKTLNIDGTSATTDAVTVKLVGNALTLDANGAGGAIDTLTLNSATAANTVTLADEAAATKITATGDKALTIKTGNTAADAVEVVNSLTGGAALTLELTTIASAVDLSKVAASTLVKVNAVAGGNIDVKSGATVELAKENALNSSSAVTLNTSTAGTLNVNVTKATAAGTDKITTGTNVGVLTLSNNTGATLKLADLDNTAVTANSNKITVNLLGTNDITLTDWSAKTGSVLNAAGFTGKLTVDGISTATGAVIIGGAGGLVATGGASADTIVGGDAVDTITATAGADSVTGGAGADVFVFDTAKSITTGSAYTTITDFAKGSDKLVLTSASDGAVDLTSITPASGIYTFGTNTKFYINLQNEGSGLTATTLADSVQLGSATVAFTGTNITGGNFDDNITTTATGGATLKAGAGNDSITGAAGADTITGGTGIDFITLGDDSTTKVADVVKFAKGDSASVTAVANAMSVANFDAVVGVIADANADVIDLSAVIGSATYAGHTAGAVTVLTDFTTVDLNTDNKFYVVQGTITVGKFSANNTGDDYLVIYDADSTSAVSYEGISLVGVSGTPAITYADGKLSIGV